MSLPIFLMHNKYFQNGRFWKRKLKKFEEIQGLSYILTTFFVEASLHHASSTFTNHKEKSWRKTSKYFSRYYCFRLDRLMKNSKLRRKQSKQEITFNFLLKLNSTQNNPKVFSNSKFTSPISIPSLISLF